MDIRTVITDGRNTDFVLLSDLVDEEYYQRFGESYISYKKFNTLENINDVVLLFDKNRCVACGGFRPYDQNTVEIKRMYVLKSYRGKGLSKLIVKGLEDIAKDKGYNRAILETGKSMRIAINLYKSLGYEEIKNFEPYENDVNSFCMGKRL